MPNGFIVVYCMINNVTHDNNLDSLYYIIYAKNRICSKLKKKSFKIYIYETKN